METLELTELIKLAKCDRDAMEEILKRFTPLIRKTAYKLFFLEREDAMQELYIALMRAVHSIVLRESEAECIKYFQQALFFRCSELRKESLKTKEPEVMYDDLEWKPAKEEWLDCIFQIDLGNIIEKMDENQREIARMVIEGYSDQEIAMKTKLSRQYVNRIKKKMFQSLLSEKS